MASSTIKNPNNVVYEDITQTIDAFAAGNPGSRAAQYIISDIGKTGYSIINAVMKSHPDSATMNCKPFLAGNNETGIYLNVYRASGSAYSGGGSAKIRVTYLKN